ncbi:glucosamine-6-phosphate isomerase [Macrococcus hajekii]|uniref:Glucosamine-6-phosphate isomerase n=1 Tax=Macrococcus hajekii TaxID=198482 RepID=A0A4R6BLA2_9STAP|nr:glucosamine-6-phosphate isomerase [Macrococcus hajekii]TDM02560.1 glucosamine-6-phosphate isomerase [Macrococcus hajekii]GGB01967.1 glucosamine-6-phosphate isomerase [Macrococcus hajekii]
MAMNFKIFETEGIASQYAADIVRKQFNNNPTSIVVFALNDEQKHFYRQLHEEIAENPVDASQIHIFDYDSASADFLNMGMVKDQLHSVKKTVDIEGEIKDKAKTKENKGKLTMFVGTLNADGTVGYREVNADSDKGLLTAREIVLLVTGSHKADVIAKLYSSNETNTDFEAGNLKSHRMTTVILDWQAAQGLPTDVRDYYYSVFS